MAKNGYGQYLLALLREPRSLAMKVTPTAIPDVLLVEPRVFGDDARLLLRELEPRARSPRRASTPTFVQDNHSRSRRGVLRGLHYQIEHAQGKLVRVVAGEVYDVAVDLRRVVADVRPLRRRDAVGGRTSGCSGCRPDSRTASSCCPRPPTSSTRRPTTGIPEHERTLLWNDPALGDRLAARRRADARGQGRRGRAARRRRHLSVAGGARPQCRRPTHPRHRRRRAARLRARRAARARYGDVVAVDRATLDLADPDAIVAACASSRRDLIVNAAAYTAVDRAETERDARARASTRARPGILADEAKRRRRGADPLLDRLRVRRRGARPPYAEDAPTAPLNVYGATQARRRAGDRRGSARTRSSLRTSWVYGLRGSEFPADDPASRGASATSCASSPTRSACPTGAATLAEATARIVARRPAGAGRARRALSPLVDGQRRRWFDFARAIVGDARGRAWCRSRPPTIRRRRAGPAMACSPRALRADVRLRPAAVARRARALCREPGGTVAIRRQSGIFGLTDCAVGGTFAPRVDPKGCPAPREGAGVSA